MEIELQTPSVFALECVALDMREADVMEVWRSAKLRPMDALDRSVRMSQESIAIIIDAISGYFPRISPHIGSEVRVTVINASIEHGYDHIARTG